MSTIFYGAVVSPTSLTTYLAAPHALLSVSRVTGDIEWLEEDVSASALQDVLAKHGQTGAVDLVELKTGEFLMPGFVDTHAHAPQVPNVGSGQQYELLDWLTNVTFPMEARFSDVEFAKKAYPSVVQRIVDCGTTTCCYYSTYHLESTKVLADIVHSRGQRAFVGKCNMDRNSVPYYVEPSVEVSMANTRTIIAYIRALPAPSPREPLVHPILTPRFAMGCTPQLLAALGALAHADPALSIQTHMDENAGEIAATRRLFPPASLPPAPAPQPPGCAGRGTYAGVYDAYGLLRANTVLAHCVHLEEPEVAIMAARRVGVAHCPTSNFNLRSGCARVGMLLDRGIKVGLGTDVSGGFSPSMLRAVQDASICSKVVAMQAPPADGDTGFAGQQLRVATLLYLATRGGAEVCNLEGRIGSLAPGKAFDALVVSVRDGAGNPGVWGADLDDALGMGTPGREGARWKTEEDELRGHLERFFFCGDDRNIRRVYVQGRMIGGKEFRG
ncbi:hypothetical protein IEO21_01869 [Rhodonia placenta]|uniref:Probable guanine deaminase n=1 Tax=Rhodonia placenta TaxID=104341 RepID=A0A8H7P8Q8_9APHY|nr:hypothetical protein IEO21_01869 [Postia placenta]